MLDRDVIELVQHRPDRLHARELGHGQHHRALRRRDALDLAGCHRASHEPHPALRRQIAGEAPEARDQSRILDPADRAADPGLAVMRMRAHAAARSSARRVTVRTRSRRYFALACRSSSGSTAAAAASAAAAKASRGRLLAVERCFGFRDAARTSFGAANANMHVGDNAILKPIGHQRHRDRVVAGTPAEFVKAEPGIGGKQRQMRFHQQFVLGEIGGHRPVEEIVGRKFARTAQCFWRSWWRRASPPPGTIPRTDRHARAMPQKVPRVRIG